MKTFVTKLLKRFNLIDDSLILESLSESYKIFYLHVITEGGIEDIVVSGDEKICTPEDLANFILYNFSVSTSEDILASLETNKNSKIDGTKVVEAYIKSSEILVRAILEKSMKDVGSVEKVVYNSDDPVISPLDIYSNTKVIK